MFIRLISCFWVFSFLTPSTAMQQIKQHCFIALLIILFIVLVGCAQRPSLPSPLEGDVLSTYRLTARQANMLSYISQYLSLGKLNQAGEIFAMFAEEEKQKLLNHNLRYNVLLGAYWLQTKQAKRAQTHFQSAILRFPQSMSLVNNYGLFLLTTGAHRLACEQFKKVIDSSYVSLKSALINLSRCELMNKNINKSQMYLKQAKEIADLPYIGLLTELNLALIQSDSERVLRIYKTLQTEANKAHSFPHKNEYDCLSRLTQLVNEENSVNLLRHSSLCISISR